MKSLDQVNNKIIDRSDIRSVAEQLRKEGKTIVFTNGCFDLLHKGHVDYLARAADLADVLLVALNSDESVSRLKGSHRPIQNYESRSSLMASLGFVGLVTVFDEDTPAEIIEEVQPNVLVKGGDYTLETIVGADYVLSNGGEVKVIPFLPGFSTSKIEERIRTSKK